MACMVTFPSMSCLEDILQPKIWYKMEYQGLYFGITMDRLSYFIGKVRDNFVIFERHE